MHVSASSRAVPTRCCPLTARHLHAPGGAPRRCQRHGAASVKCIATAGAPDESSGGDGQSLWGGLKGSSDSPQAPPAAGRDPPRGGVSGSGAGARADSRSTGARGAWGLSSNDKALPLSLLYPYERLPTGDKVRGVLCVAALGTARQSSAADTLWGSLLCLTNSCCVRQSA